MNKFVLLKHTILSASCLVILLSCLEAEGNKIILHANVKPMDVETSGAVEIAPLHELKSIRAIPDLPVLSCKEFKDLADKANAGDLDVQKEIILRVYWSKCPDNWKEFVLWQNWQALKEKDKSDLIMYFLMKVYTGDDMADHYKNDLLALKGRAESGNPIAQDVMGYAYFDGKGVAQNYAKAVKWFTKAAEQEHAPAQYSIGICYQLGLGVAQDDIEAVKWYKTGCQSRVCTGAI